MLDSLAKRTFLAARVCTTYGWLEQHAAPSPRSAGDEWRFYFGSDIGARAREALGSGRMLPAAPLNIALDASRAAIEDPASALLFEVSFAARNCVARADALRRTAAGWDLIEVKSGKSPDGKAPNDDYLDDVAFTLFVARAAGLTVQRAILFLVNRDYRLDGAAPMFVEVDVTAEAFARSEGFDAIAAHVTDVVLRERKPTPQLIFECKDCPHFDDCMGAGIDDHIFVLPRLSAKRFEELRHHERISKLPATVTLTGPQQRIADVCRAGKPCVESQGLSILQQVEWPAYYLDFEAVMPPLPWFAGSPPFDAVPFQYSLDRCDGLHCEPEHFEYLAPVDGDWRRDMTETLIAQLGTSGSIVVYSSYEKTRLNALAVLFPDLATPIGLIVERLFDLERVFKHGYCHPRFGGRTSIKKVLPVMVEHLSYDGLPIANGDDALAIFSLMRVGKYAPESHRDHRKNLLRYCGVDTRAMVELHRAVAALAAP